MRTFTPASGRDANPNCKWQIVNFQFSVALEAALYTVRVKDSQARNTLKIARVPRDDDGLGSVRAGGDQGVGNLDADQFPNLNRPLNHRIGNSNFLKLVQLSADSRFLLLAEIGKTEDFNPSDGRIDYGDFWTLPSLLQNAHAVRHSGQGVNHDVAVQEPAH
jgi:hypothetical protein